MKTGTVYTTSSVSGTKNLPALLDAARLPAVLKQKGIETILVKPNLVEALAPPITTPVGLVGALVEYLQAKTRARIIIAEGCGAMNYDTWYVFQKLGYVSLAERLHVELLDLNDDKGVVLTNPTCRRWPEMYLPRIALESFLISVPVLKAHSMAGVTLTMKNMIGLAPPSRYQLGSSWKKSAFHHHIQDAVADLNRYRTPDFTVLDATVGMAKAHLWGPPCDPPVGILAAGFDPVAIDSYGTGLLKKKWQDIGHIRTVNGELGTAEPLKIIRV